MHSNCFINCWQLEQGPGDQFSLAPEFKSAKVSNFFKDIGCQLYTCPVNRRDSLSYVAIPTILLMNSVFVVSET